MLTLGFGKEWPAMTSVIEGKPPAAVARKGNPVRTRASLPVVPLTRPEIPDKDRNRLDAIAARWCDLAAPR